MAKHAIKGFITWRNRYDKEDIDFLTYDPRQFDHNDRVVIREETIEVEIPDNFDPRPQMVAELERQKQKTRSDFTKRIKELDDQISRLLAIENTVEA